MIECLRRSQAERAAGRVPSPLDKGMMTWNELTKSAVVARKVLAAMSALRRR